MKKILTTFLIIFLFLFVFEFNVVKGKENIYEENYHIINFDNLNSRDINSLFEDVNETVIEIEVDTQFFTKNYRFHTGLNNDVERILLEYVTRDLKELGKQELATSYQINGIRINRMGIICTNEELNIIRKRTKIL